MCITRTPIPGVEIIEVQDYHPRIEIDTLKALSSIMKD
jgi:hypothetical protein